MTNPRLILRRSARVNGYYVPCNHTVIGTPQELANVVDNHRNAGTLLDVTTPQPANDGRYRISLRVNEYRPGPPPMGQLGTAAQSRRPKPRRHRTAVVTGILGTTAGIVTATAYLIGQLAQFLADHAATIGVALLVIGLFIAALGRTRRCVGLHCNGCTRH